jgi:hypothetical protein
MKVCVVIDSSGNIISLHEPAKSDPSAKSSQIRMSAHANGKVFSLDAPPSLKGRPLTEIHDSVRIDLSGRKPTLKRK